MKNCNITLLILLNFLISFDASAQTDWPNLSKDTPGISIEDYEPPLYEPAKKLWLPDSIESSYDYAIDSKMFKNVYEKNSTVHLKISDSALMAGIHDSNGQNRRMYISNLANTNNIEIYRFIGGNLLLDSDIYVQQFAIKKIRDTLILSNKMKLEESIPFIQNRKSLIEAGKTLVEYGNDSLGLQVLKSVFFRSNPEEQVEILYFIRKIKSNESIEFLFNAVESNNIYVSTSASLILAQLGDRKISFDKLSSQINNADRFIRIIAITGLAYIHDEKSLEYIKSKISDPDKKVKNIAIAIYSKLKT